MLSAFVPLIARAVPVFPGAEGFGTETPGGRGGQVLVVTTLDDHNDGVCDADCTLREAIAVTGPRIVTFAVGGTITLGPFLGPVPGILGPLEITEPFLTIAGQSAPGGGIQIRNDPDGIDGLQTGHCADSNPSINIHTHDVVLRYLRIRPGPLNENAECLDPMTGGLNAVPNPPSAPYGGTCCDAGDIVAISIKPSSYNIVMDHLSLSWASDELIQIVGATDITVQRSIIAEGMNYVLYHGFVSGNPGQPAFAGKGIIIGDGSVAGVEDTGRISLHHNLWAHNSARNPQMSPHCIDPNHPEDCFSDGVNNVAYNWQNFAVNMNNFPGHHFSNMIGNYFKSGVDGPQSGPAAFTVNEWNVAALVPGSPDLSFHFSDNKRDLGGGASDDVPVDCVIWNDALQIWEFICTEADFDPGQPYATAPITTTSAVEAYTDVTSFSGADALIDGNGNWVTARDSTDARIVSDVLNGTGAIIRDIDDFLGPPRNGWPTLAAGTAPTDSDGDGMPDAWEIIQCLDDAVANDAVDSDGDVYTNVEEFLNGTDATDTDADGVLDHLDNCSDVANASQTDDDPIPDGFGDACDCDSNGDGDCDNQDNAKFDFCMNKKRIPECNWADMNDDGEFDSADQALFDAAAADNTPGPGEVVCTL